MACHRHAVPAVVGIVVGIDVACMLLVCVGLGACLVSELRALLRLGCLAPCRGGLLVRGRRLLLRAEASRLGFLPMLGGDLALILAPQLLPGPQSRKDREQDQDHDHGDYDDCDGAHLIPFERG